MLQPIVQILSDVATRLEAETFAQLEQARYRDPQNFSISGHNLLKRLFEAYDRYPQYFRAIRRHRIEKIRNGYNTNPERLLRGFFEPYRMRPNGMVFEKEAEKMKPSKRYVEKECCG